jgi:hypothetical protein
MTNLNSASNLTDLRPGGEFLLFAGDLLLGRSELEWEDATEGVWLRSGTFDPVEAYSTYQDLFRRHTRELCYARLGTGEFVPTTLHQLAEQIGALNLRLVHPDGSQIPVASLEIQDCSDTLAKVLRELHVEIHDPQVHDRYFSQAIAQG